jgi:hypothetical protein
MKPKHSSQNALEQGHERVTAKSMRALMDKDLQELLVIEMGH